MNKRELEEFAEDVLGSLIDAGLERIERVNVLANALSIEAADAGGSERGEIENVVYDLYHEVC